MARALALGICCSVALAGAAYVLIGAGDGVAVPLPDGLAPLPDAAMATSSAPARSAVPAAARIWLEVTPRQRLFASGDRIHVTRFGREREVLAEVVAGDGGPWRARGQRRGASLVQVEDGETVVFRRVEPDANGELHIELGVARTLSGRVVDAAAKPIEGALVWFGEATASTVMTNSDGRYEAVVAASLGVPVVVRKSGKAWKHAFVEVSPTVGASADFVLVDAATLVVQAAGSHEALAGAFAVVLPGATPTTELQAFPFFAQGFWTDSLLDGNGRLQIEGLPRDCVPSIVIGGPLVLRTAAIEVALHGDQAAVVTAAVPDRDILSGKLVDERGQPVPVASVACVRADVTQEGAAEQGLWPASLPPRDASVGVAAADGSFRIARPAGHEAIVVVARAGAVNAAAEPFSPDDSEATLVLPSRVAATASIQIAPPQPGVAWEVRVDPVTEGRFVVMVADQPFIAQFETAMVADLSVRVPDGDSWSVPRELRGFVIGGPTTLPRQLTQR